MNRSSSAVTFFGRSGRSSPRFMRTKRAMFHTLFRKLRLASMSRIATRIPRPLEEDWASVNRRASIPYDSLTSKGSMMFPFDELIFIPFSSSMRGVKYTWRNGTLPMKWSPITIILATQKKMMSNPVINSEVG